MDFSFVPAHAGVLLDAALLTIALSVVALVGGALIGLAVATLRILGGPLLDLPLAFLVDLIRGTPLLVQMLAWYLGSTLVSVDIGGQDVRLELSPFAAAMVALSVNAGAFISEIIRGALRSLPRGQREAALAIGLSRTYSLRAIELPQALIIVVPALVSFSVGLIKDTSVAYIVGLHEVLRSSQFIADFERKPLEIYLVAGGIYFILCFPLTRFAARLERRLRTSGTVQERLAV